MAAGFTVLFGPPPLGALSALEILHRRGLEYYEALLPSVIGAIGGYAMYVVAPAWAWSPCGTSPGGRHQAGGPRVGDRRRCGGRDVAIAFTYLCTKASAFSSPPSGRGRPPARRRPGLARVGIALRADLRRGADGARHHRRGGDPHVARAAAAKFVAAEVTVVTGWKGGFIIPLFFIGFCLARVGPTSSPQRRVGRLIAGLMVACNVGVTKTPIGSDPVVTEMAGPAPPHHPHRAARGPGAHVERRADREPAPPGRPRIRPDDRRPVAAPRGTRSPRGGKRSGAGCGTLSTGSWLSSGTRLRLFLRFRRTQRWHAGMTPNQHQLLLTVRGFPAGEPTISDLAERLQLRHNSTVELIDRAVEAGLLEPPRRRHRPSAAAPGPHRATGNRCWTRCRRPTARSYVDSARRWRSSSTNSTERHRRLDR